MWIHREVPKYFRFLFIGFAFVLTLGLVAAVLLSQADNQAQVNENASPDSVAVAGEFLMKPFPKVPADKTDQVLARFGLAKKSTAPKELEELGILLVADTKKTPDQAAQQAHDQDVLAALKGTGHFAYVEQNGYVKATQVTPNDPWFPNWQKELQWVRFPYAWQTAKGLDTIVVAVVDTGVNVAHEELVGKLVAGTNILDGGSDVTDEYGHGTKVAGTVTVLTDNALGIAGACWYCKIMPIKIAGAGGSAYYSDMAAGIKYAADNGAKIANLSYGAKGNRTVESAAKYLYDKGGITTISMGNQGILIDKPNVKEAVYVGAAKAGDPPRERERTGQIMDQYWTS